MRQYVLPQIVSGEGVLKISGSDSKYILKILRLKKGDSFPAVGKDGRLFTLRITDIGNNFFNAHYSEKEQKKLNKNNVKITLIQCLPKGKKLETIVRQAVESGVSKIVPAESENSVAIIKDDRYKKKTARLEKIAEEAAQQSGNIGVPEILDAIKLSELTKFLSKDQQKSLKLFFHQEKLAKTSLHSYLNNAQNNIIMVIGPEGGLSPKETILLLDSGFKPVYLGDNVLRTETAAIFALGAVKTILLEKSEWKAATPI